MLLHESRRAARTSPKGDLICWRIRTARLGPGPDREGKALVERHCLHAASARTPSRRRSRQSTRRPHAAATDWGQIVGLYDVLLQADPSPVVELNRAVAVAMRDGPAQDWR